MIIHILPVHEQYIKYFPVLRALYNSSMIKNRKISSVSFSKMEVNIKTIENNWSRDVLLNFLGTDLYERQGKCLSYQ